MRYPHTGLQNEHFQLRHNLLNSFPVHWNRKGGGKEKGYIQSKLLGPIFEPPGTKNGLTLANLTGKSYDDPDWDK